MNDKPLQIKQIRLAEAATGLHPADFPLGSVESRAAARFVLSQLTPKLTPDDQDCLVLHFNACLVRGTMVPDSRSLEATAAYQRGKKLRDALYGPVIPYHQNPHRLPSNLASLYFEQLHGREPIVGDVLRRTDWEDYHARELLHIAHFIEAWQRQIPALPCPLKIEDESRVYEYKTLYRSELPRDYPGRETMPTRWDEWCEDKEHTVERWWESIDYTVNVPESEMKNIQAITFLGVIDGEHRCRPATEAEITKEQR